MNEHNGPKVRHIKARYYDEEYRRQFQAHRMHTRRDRVAVTIAVVTFLLIIFLASVLPIPGTPVY